MTGRDLPWRCKCWDSWGCLDAGGRKGPPLETFAAVLVAGITADVAVTRGEVAGTVVTGAEVRETAEAVIIGAEVRAGFGFASQSSGPKFSGVAIGHSVTAGNVIWAIGHTLVNVARQGTHVDSISSSRNLAALNLFEFSV